MCQLGLKRGPNYQASVVSPLLDTGEDEFPDLAYLFPEGAGYRTFDVGKLR